MEIWEYSDLDPDMSSMTSSELFLYFTRELKFSSHDMKELESEFNGHS